MLQGRCGAAHLVRVVLREELSAVPGILVQHALHHRPHLVDHACRRTPTLKHQPRNLWVMSSVTDRLRQLAAWLVCAANHSSWTHSRRSGTT